MPVKGERVLGVVVKTGRVHRVDINAALPASLPELSFQGATRRNKPSLQVRGGGKAGEETDGRERERGVQCI